MRLDVWIEGVDRPIGLLERHEDKTMSFIYAADADMDVSLSMPRRDVPYGDAACRAFFSNLLFEGPELNRTRSLLGLDIDDVAGLLHHVGGDCAGAVSITPEGAGPGKFPGQFPEDYAPLPEADLRAIVTSLARFGRLPDAQRSPSPLAGYQGKLAVLRREGGFYLPRNGTGAPTTHILKISPANDPHVTSRETALLGIARTAGLDAASAENVTFTEGDHTVNACCVERFDRLTEGGGVHRLHGEDLCQAIGLPPDLKYEYDAVREDMTFTAKRVGGVMARLSSPAGSMRKMLDQTLFNVLVGNTDNHGKNTTLLRDASGTIDVSPLYDVVPVFMDLTVTHNLGMRIGEAEFVDQVRAGDLSLVMKDFGFAKPDMKRLRERMSHFVDGIQTWAEPLGGVELADALSAQMRAVERGTGFDLGVAERGSYDRFSHDGHWIGF